MSKELEALENLYHNVGNSTENYLIIETALKENTELRTRNYELLKESEHFYNERNKYKQALEIIKRKGIDINALIRANNCAEYNSMAKSCIGYTQEEYDLLIEVML